MEVDVEGKKGKRKFHMLGDALCVGCDSKPLALCKTVGAVTSIACVPDP